MTMAVNKAVMKQTSPSMMMPFASSNGFESRAEKSKSSEGK
ncbi:hypothetical protein AAULR_02964 [Lacticaseibacillus rhamnosus MTCC 5462]|nr:hypothetical protein AAULR_02964 [Lacticaseibacillus rhamnosus MTCC 5462]